MCDERIQYELLVYQIFSFYNRGDRRFEVKKSSIDWLFEKKIVFVQINTTFEFQKVHTLMRLNKIVKNGIKPFVTSLMFIMKKIYNITKKKKYSLSYLLIIKH